MNFTKADIFRPLAPIEPQPEPQPNQKKYSALLSIAGGFRFMAWIVAIVTTILALVSFSNGTALAIQIGIEWLAAAVLEWMILTAIAEQQVIIVAEAIGGKIYAS